MSQVSRTPAASAASRPQQRRLPENTLISSMPGSAQVLLEFCYSSEALLGPALRCSPESCFPCVNTAALGGVAGAWGGLQTGSVLWVYMSLQILDWPSTP